MGMFLYRIGSRIFPNLVRLAAPFNRRAKKLIESRKQSIEIPPKGSGETRLWVHAASLGEFEQARPVLEELKKFIPGLTIACSFFSPSGYEILKNDSLIDFSFYLPFESKSNADVLVQKISPDFVLWVKYEFWLDYLQAIHRFKIPSFLIAASFQANQRYFGLMGGPYIQAFKNFKLIFTQTKESTRLLQKSGIQNSIHTGDPRFDRVIRGSKSPKTSDLIQKFKGNKKLLILGSSYAWEEEMVAKVLASFPELKVLIVPHFIDEENILRIEKLFPGCSRFSESNPQMEFSNTMVLNKIGWLSGAYQYADAALIGGGSKKKGLHNVLEPAVFGLPLAFGRKISYFPETKELLESGQADLISSPEEVKHWLDKSLSAASTEMRKQWKLGIQQKEGIAHEIAKRIYEALK